jgi:ABC-type dipeptide/oligopeptide/nickel transport system permease subunit
MAATSPALTPNTPDVGKISASLERVKMSSPLQLAWARFRRNKLGMVGTVIVALFIFVGLAAPILAPYAYDKGGFKFNQPPGTVEGHPLGTDEAGRDFLSRLIYGARTSLFISAGVLAITLTFGLVIGFVSAWFGGIVDFAISRVVEIFVAIPALLFQMLMVLVLGGTMLNVIIAIALLSWMEMARLVRGQVLSWREREFIDAARSLGVSTASIAWRHVLPNIMNSVVVAVTFALPAAILAEATLSFFGLGINAPIPSWGRMVGVAASFANRLQQFWHLGILPAALLSTVMLGFSFFGDALRDALDPRASR